MFWIDLRTDPDLDKCAKIKDNLLEKIIQRGHEIKNEENRERAAIGATYFAQGQASIEYLKSRRVHTLRVHVSDAKEIIRSDTQVPVQSGNSNKILENGNSC